MIAIVPSATDLQGSYEGSFQPAESCKEDLELRFQPVEPMVKRIEVGEDVIESFVDDVKTKKHSLQIRSEDLPVKPDEVIPCQRLGHEAILPRPIHYAEGFYGSWNSRPAIS